MKTLRFLITFLCVAAILSSTSCKKDEATEPGTPSTTTNPVDTTGTGDTTLTSNFKDNTMRQLTGDAKDFELNHMYAQRWENVYNDAGNQEGVLKFDIRGPLDQKRMLIYFSGMTSLSKTYNSSVGSKGGNVKLKPDEFVIEKISVGSSNQNYWWKPNDAHTASLKISGDDVIIEIKDFELGGGLGSIGKETFNVKFEFNLDDYNALGSNKLKLIKFN